jgi:hypothetical protein
MFVQFSILGLMRKRDASLFRAFTFHNRAALGVADSLGNLTITQHTVSLVQAAVGRFRGLAGSFEIAHMFSARPTRPAPARQPVSLVRGMPFRAPEPS